MRKILLGLLLVLVILIGVVLVRTFAVSSKQIKAEAVKHIALGDDVVERFSKSITFKTVSWQDPSMMDSSQFTGFHQFLAEAYPLMDSLLEKQYINGFSLLYKWQGTDAGLKPVLFMAHQDVVPVDTAKLNMWEEPPFSGAVSNGYIHGRGTQDVKCQIMEIHEAAEYLLAQGYQPKRTVYFAFGHDEEIGGEEGAKKIAEYLEQQGVQLEFLMDEGGSILHGVVPGLQKPVAVIGIAEKGYVSFELTVNGTGGHSSMPPKETAIGILSKAISRLEDNPYPVEITGVSGQMFDYLGPEMDFPMKMAMANRWLLGGVIAKELAKGNSGRATLHTTTAPTIFQAGTKENVLPTTAKAIVNHRILPGNSIEYLLQRNKEIINDERVEIKPVNEFEGTEASPVSDVNSESFQIVQRTLSEVFPDVVVAPYLLVGATDSKHYQKITENIYRFQPMRMDSEALERIHGHDEKHSVDNYKESVNFFIQLIQNSTTR